MRNNKGISLITLIVTIMVMLILIGVVGTYSLETIMEANEAVAEREFANVRDFVLKQQTDIQTEKFDMNSSKYPELIISPELTFLLCDGRLTSTELGNIADVNTSEIDAKYKYYYFQADSKSFEDSELTNNGITVQDVQNDYIINFYSGTIICVTCEYFKVEGIVKGLGEFLLEE